jgi:hypothetical protein
MEYKVGGRPASAKEISISWPGCRGLGFLVSAAGELPGASIPVAAQKHRMLAPFLRNCFQFMDGAFSFNCGDPLFIISKAPPGAKSDKKLMKILVYWKYSASSAAPGSGANLQAG